MGVLQIKISKSNIIDIIIIFILFISVALCLIERISQCDAPMAEATIQSLKHLAPMLPNSYNNYPPSKPSLFAQTEDSYPDEEIYYQNCQRNCLYNLNEGAEGAYDLVTFVERTDGGGGDVFFNDFVEYFDLTECTYDLEEIEMNALILKNNEEEFYKLIEEQKEKCQFKPSPWPTHGWISSSFGYRTSPFTKKRAFHKGIDIATHYGTPIYATNRGVIKFSGRKGEYGNAIIIQHGFGYATLYGHTSINVIKSGDKVERGQLIGYVGNTGRSTAPHLHYEVRKEKRCINPRKYLQSKLF